MEEWSTNSTAMKGSVSMALLSFIVTKDSGMALNQAVSQMVSIPESCLALIACLSQQQQHQQNFILFSTINVNFKYTLVRNLNR